MRSKLGDSFSIANDAVYALTDLLPNNKRISPRSTSTMSQDARTIDLKHVESPDHGEYDGAEGGCNTKTGLDYACGCLK